MRLKYSIFPSRTRTLTTLYITYIFVCYFERTQLLFMFLSEEYSNKQLETPGVTVLNHEIPKLKGTNGSKSTFISRGL